MPKTYAPPKLNPRQMQAVEAGEYDFLIPTLKTLMRTDEVAKAIGRSQNFVRMLGEDGQLEKHSSSALTEGRLSSTYTRRSVIMHLVETSNYDPAFLVMRVEVILKTFTEPALDRIIAFCTRQKNAL